ncbi:MAG: Nramp family divalent metal transporter [Gemmatimonadota bacterium]|nr:Nramp family divalent metal transporter [Gemmatimonadota bacterium]
MRLPKIGPGAVVTAALIWPGTVVVCLRAGVDFGYGLIWVLVVATLVAVVIQELAARLGVAGGLSLGEAIHRRFARRPWGRTLVAILVICGIGIGNAAYQAGNLLGAARGAQLLTGGSATVWMGVVALAAGTLLWIGRYRLLEGVLIAAVLVMALTFPVIAGLLVREPGALVAGSLVPRLPDGAALTALALAATMLVPYALFVHALAARERWRGTAQLPQARADLVITISLGGVIAIAIVVIGASQPGRSIASPAALAILLDPQLGGWATSLFAVGLVAAGLTSAITAPLAAAYAVSGVLGWVQDLRSPLLRIVWVAVMMIGLGFAVAGVHPRAALSVAQAANGILLPAAAVFLFVVANDRRLLKGASNGWVGNALGGAMVIATLVLGAAALWGLMSAGR